MPFEYYYWSDDRPGYPTVFPIELKFSGTLDRERFSAALEQTLARQPMLRALIDDTAAQRPVWVPSGEIRPFIDWAAEGIPIDHPDGERIDLTRSVGLRIWVREAAAATRVLLQFHHACCDGIGALGFVEDLLVGYSLATGSQGKKVRFRELDPARLNTRGEFGMGLSTRKASAREIWRLARIWQRLLFRQPAVLGVPACGGGDRGPAAPLLHFETLLLDPPVERKLRRVAVAHGAALNDLLLRDLFQVLHDWNREYRPTARDRRLRINMPTDLRRREDALMPAADVLGFAFLTRKAGDCHDGRRLLETIHRETTAIRERRLGLYFVGGVALAGRIEGLVPWLLRQERCFATAVLSNLGKVLVRAPLERRERRLVSGDVVLESVTGVPPIRPHTRASFAIVSYAGRTTVNLRCDPSLFSAEHTRRLLATYMAQLRQTSDRGE